MKVPGGEKLRFLLAGGFNTVFGIADTFFFTFLFTHLRPGHDALMASAATAVSTVLNITVSFLVYKYFVFQSKGSTLHEYLRSLLVYLPSMVISATAVGPLTILLQHRISQPQFAPYIAQAILVAFSMIFSFVGHKYVTFRKRAAE